MVPGKRAAMSHLQISYTVVHIFQHVSLSPRLQCQRRPVRQPLQTKGRGQSWRKGPGENAGCRVADTVHARSITIRNANNSEPPLRRARQVGVTHSSSLRTLTFVVSHGLTLAASPLKREGDERMVSGTRRKRKQREGDLTKAERTQRNRQRQ